MNRAIFLQRLADGLKQLPAQTRAEILSDYERYFVDGVARGRNDEETAAALGDPARLAREHDLEAAMKQWNAHRTPGAALAILFALVTLDFVGFILLAPLVLTIGVVLLAWLIVITGAFMAGIYFTLLTPFDAPTHGPLAMLLRGAGLLAAALSAGAGLALVVKFLSAALAAQLAWLTRLHERAGRAIPPLVLQGDQK